MIADHTAHDVPIAIQTVVWNSCGQHEYLLVYSFKLKSAFDTGSLLLMPVSLLADSCVLWLNDNPYSKSV